MKRKFLLSWHLTKINSAMGNVIAIESFEDMISSNEENLLAVIQKSKKLCWEKYSIDSRFIGISLGQIIEI